MPNPKKLDKIKKIAEDAIRISCFTDKGPVHVNFPFEKPFEPKSYTDEIDVRTIEKLFSNSAKHFSLPNQKKINFDALAAKFGKTERGLILVGFNNYETDFGKHLVNFSKTFGYPIYVDGAATLRFGNHSKNYFIDNLTSVVRAKSFQKQFDPEIIIQFGSAPTANVLLEYFKNSKAEKFLVNDFGDKNDPSLTAKNIIACNPAEFCESVVGHTKKKAVQKTNWLKNFLAVQKIAEEIKNKTIVQADFPFEGRVATELAAALPDKSNLMFSNSLPIRDVDFFASSNEKRLNIFTNRGASGIDGINSTALGIAKASKEPTFLLTGDLAFYHDSNGLHSAIKHGIPLTVILINNSGGGIFESLPISDYPEFFTANFLTPLELDFAKLVKAYYGDYVRVGSWAELRKQVGISSKRNALRVIEIRTDARKSKLLRQKYWDVVAKKIDEFIDEITR
ncbi:MAG: thiamine pyrophosphate-dependent enzyme [Bacteroidetes bacterium]|nr:thiamine pyrophosphate-dependent enzyme [Bacteroidota bacterium]